MSGERPGAPPSTRFSGLRQLARACATRLATGAAACTPLAAFNAVVPKDPSVRRVLHGAAFGSHPLQRLDLYVPKGIARGDRLPTIVWIYGGSWSSGARGGYGFAARALAAQGFVVAVPDYRLVPEVRFPAFLEDNAAAVRWLRMHLTEFGGDPDRMVIAGHSAGAYNAAMLALDARWLGDERSPLRGWAGLAGPYDFLPITGSVTEATFGAWPRPDETQPVSFADAQSPPAFLASGDRDAVVSPRNVQRLGSLLRSAGVDVEERIYTGVTHVGILTALARPFRRRAPVLEDVARFAHRVTTPATETVTGA